MIELDKNINSEDALDFLIDYYKEKSVITNKKDWEMIKKYKNLKNETCRDFIFCKKNKWYGTRCVVIVNYELNSVSFLENGSYDYFTRQKPNWIVFNYCIIKSDKGLFIQFALKDDFKNLEINEKAFLDIRLSETVKVYKHILSDAGVHIYQIVKLEIEDICEKLQRDRFDLVNDEFLKIPLFIAKNYELIKVDKEYFTYDSRIFESIDLEMCVDKVLSLVSKGEYLKKYDIGLIKKLLVKLPKEEVEMLEKMILGFDIKDKEVIKNMFLQINNVKKHETCFILR